MVDGLVCDHCLRLSYPIYFYQEKVCTNPTPIPLSNHYLPIFHSNEWRRVYIMYNVVDFVDVLDPVDVVDVGDI